LLVLVVVVAIPCSWLAVEMKKASEQAAAVDMIELAGGYVLATEPHAVIMFLR
jgi:hypothetical protein